MTPQFPEADFYTCHSHEELAAQTPEEAVESYLAFFVETHCDVPALIREISPLEVTAYRRTEIPDAWIQRQAEWLLESAAEAFGEEFGNPDGDAEADGLDKDAEKAALPLMVRALRAFYAHATVWRTEEVSTLPIPPSTPQRMPRSDWLSPWPTQSLRYDGRG